MTGEYGGKLRGRAHARPISTTNSMHIVLRSSFATGPWSFKLSEFRVQAILDKFSERHEVRLYGVAINYNHIHLHARIFEVASYHKFIRATSSAIALLTTGGGRWHPSYIQFWDRRPYTRIIVGELQEKRIRNYIRINQLEAEGMSREQARGVLRIENL